MRSHTVLSLFVLLVFAKFPLTPEWCCGHVTLCSTKNRLNGLLNPFDLSLCSKLERGSNLWWFEANIPISCFNRSAVRPAADDTPVRVLEPWCASPSSSRQLVAAWPRWRCPRCWGEQKHQSWSPPPPHSSHTGRGWAVKGEAPCVLHSIRQSVRPPWDQAAKKGAASLSYKDVQLSSLPSTESTSLVSQ